MTNGRPQRCCAPEDCVALNGIRQQLNASSTSVTPMPFMHTNEMSKHVSRSKRVCFSCVASSECRTQCLGLSRFLTSSARIGGMPHDEASLQKFQIPVSNQASHQQHSFVATLTRRHVINGEAFDVKKMSSKPQSSESSGPCFLGLISQLSSVFQMHLDSNDTSRTHQRTLAHELQPFLAHPHCSSGWCMARTSHVATKSRHNVESASRR